MSYFLIQAVREIRCIARSGMTRAMLCFHTIQKLIEPVSVDEDDRRKEYVLNVILILSLFALILLGSTVVWNKMHMGLDYDGMNPFIFGSIIVLYGSLLYISKKGYGKVASVLLVLFNASGTIYTGWKWGASLPATLLLTVLVLVTASVLIGSTAGFVTAGGMITVLTILGIHESVVFNVPTWRYDEITVTDVITYAVMFLFISFIAWLSNRQIDLSLARARRSEKLLEIDRDTLEQRVGKRTEELVTSQQKRFIELEHTVRVGELARGIMHDIMSPLSAISLYVEEMIRTPMDMENTQRMLQKTIQASQQMNNFMHSARHHINPQSIEGSMDMTTNLKKELYMAYDIFAHKARMSNVHIDIVPCDSIVLCAHPMRIHQILVNLISNAIDAYTNISGENPEQQSQPKMIRIIAERSDNVARISISDNGCGIPEEQLKTIFTKPLSTKTQGTGIGLTSTHAIVTKELGGSIDVTSKLGIGTTFIITLPIQPYGESDTTHT